MLHILSASLQQQLSSKCPSKTFCQIKARLRHRKGSKVRKRGGRLEWRPEELLQLANKVTTEAEIIGNVHILQAAGASSSYAERIQRPMQNWALNCFMGSSRRKITQKAKQAKKNLQLLHDIVTPSLPFLHPFHCHFHIHFHFVRIRQVAGNFQRGASPGAAISVIVIVFHFFIAFPLYIISCCCCSCSCYSGLSCSLLNFCKLLKLMPVTIGGRGEPSNWDYLKFTEVNVKFIFLDSSRYYEYRKCTPSPSYTTAQVISSNYQVRS